MVENYVGYNWHVISDDGTNVTLLMDEGEYGNYLLPSDSNSNLTKDETYKTAGMIHCTDGSSSNCTPIVSDNYTYSFEKSLINSYLNTTFYNSIINKIGNEIVPATICNDPSIYNTSDFSYGGYLKSQIDLIDGATCNIDKTNNYSDYNVRLLTTAEYYNISPYYSSITLPYNELTNGGVIPKIDNIKRITNSTWLYNGTYDDTHNSANYWWTMNSYTYPDEYSVWLQTGKLIKYDGEITSANGYYYGGIRPVITVVK